MNELKQETERSDRFEDLSDEDLRTIAARADEILKARVTERRKTALAEIRRIARENGLSVSVRSAARRGRPAKTKNPNKT